jgi:hypothetical protein
MIGWKERIYNPWRAQTLKNLLIPAFLQRIRCSQERSVEVLEMDPFMMHTWRVVSGGF